MTKVTNPTSTTTNAIPVMMRIARNSASIGPANVDPASGSHQRMRLSSRLVRGEGEVGRLTLGSRDRHGRRLCAELLMPCFDRIRSRRQSLDREAAVRPGDRVKRIGPHTDVRVHPTVHVALEIDHHLGRRERHRLRHAGVGLAHIERPVLLRDGLDVMQEWIGILDFDGLPHHDAKDVRMVAAAVLVQHHGSRGCREGLTRGDAGTDVHEHVRERVGGTSHHILLGGRRRVLRLTCRLFAHVDRRVARRRAGEFDLAGDRPTRGRDFRPWWCRLYSAAVSFAAHGEQEHPTHHAEDSAFHCCLRYEVFCCARHTTSMPNPRVSIMASTGEMNTRAGTGSSRAREYHVLMAMRVPCSPLDPSHAKNATGMARPVRKGSWLAVSGEASARVNTTRHWPWSYAACAPTPLLLTGSKRSM